MELHVHFRADGLAEDYTVEAVESPFYKAIGERLLHVSIPNVITVSVDEFPGACLEYEVSERGSYTRNGIRHPSMYVIETADSLYQKLEPSLDYKHVFLTCVNPESNNYKYYEIIPSGEDFFTVNYGRMNEDLLSFSNAGRTTQDPYDSRMYWIRYYEKLSKGYIDSTHIYISGNGNRTLRRKKLFAGEDGTEPQTPEDRLYYELLSYSKETVRENLGITKIMKIQLDRCNELYYELSASKNLTEFNEKLKELYAICPRKMGNLANNMASSTDRRKEILAHELSLLSAMNAVFGNEQEPKAEVLVQSPFKDWNVEVHVATPEQREHVLAHLYEELKPRVKNIYRVIPARQKERFEAYLAKNHISVVKELWHGSRNENWLSIIEKSLMLYPDAVITGKMFGDGLYFASDIYKSLNYTSLDRSYWAKGTSARGYMGLFATAYGDPLFVTDPCSYSASDLAEQGKNCVHAQAGDFLRKDEIIFYDESAVLLNYIVEFERED